MLTILKTAASLAATAAWFALVIVLCGATAAALLDNATLLLCALTLGGLLVIFVSHKLSNLLWQSARIRTLTAATSLALYMSFTPQLLILMLVFAWVLSLKTAKTNGDKARETN